MVHVLAQATRQGASDCASRSRCFTSWFTGHAGRHPKPKEAKMDKFDVAVIGAGQGGLPAAHMAASLGARVVLIEMREVGGT
jgi:threonine dehydrogenase-like Zn-dependent dehydrogenase